MFRLHPAMEDLRVVAKKIFAGAEFANRELIRPAIYGGLYAVAIEIEVDLVVFVAELTFESHE